MARKKVPTAPVLTSWNEVDQSMKEILHLQGCMEEWNVQLNRIISDAKAEVEEKSKPARERIAELELQIRDFVVQNRESLDGKSKKLNFGQTGFRISTKLVVPTNKAAEVIAACKKYKMLDCVTVKESVNKDALKRYPLASIQQVGAHLKTTDDFWYEVSDEKLINTEAPKGCG